MLTDKEAQFGQVALKAKLVTHEQLSECVRVVENVRKAGAAKELPEVLVEKGLLTTDQVRKVLRTLERRAVTCKSCSAKFQVARSSTPQQVRCPKCLAIIDVAPSPVSDAPRPMAPTMPVKEPPTHRVSPKPPPGSSLRLVCLAANAPAKTVALTESLITVGREADNTICINDLSISKHHAQISLSGEQAAVADVGSRNGTFVNDERVKIKMLVPGDVITLAPVSTCSAFILLVKDPASQAQIKGAPSLEPDCSLIGLEGPMQGQTVPLGNEPITLGRDKLNSVSVADAAVADFQAQIAAVSGAPRILNLAAGGLKVNGQPVKHRVLRTGDVIALGRSTFRFERATSEVFELEPIEDAAAAGTPGDSTQEFQLSEADRQEMMMSSTALVEGIGDEEPPRADKRDGTAEMLALEVVCIHGPCKGEKFPVFGRPAVIGSAREATIYIKDRTVSRQHAKITIGKDGLEVLDLGSKNGTEVNGKRVEDAVLKVGDTIRAGKTILVLQHTRPT